MNQDPEIPNAKSQPAGEETRRLADVSSRILDAIPASIVLLDDKLTILDANRRYVSRHKPSLPYLGRLIGEVFPRSLMEYIGLEAVLLDCLATGETRHLTDIPHISEEHEMRWLNIQIYPFDGTMQGNLERKLLILVIEDVSSYVDMRKEYEAINEAVVQSNRELQSTMEQLNTAQSELIRNEKMASVGQLAAGVAHEINNPIAYILSNLHTLSQYGADLRRLITDYRDIIGKTGDKRLIGEIEEAEKRYDIDAMFEDSVSIVNENIEGAVRIRDIVRDLSTFSRMDIGRIGKVNVNRVLESAIKMVFHEVKHRAQLKRDLGILPEIYADAGQLGQIFLNLILNAAQAIPQGHSESNTISVVTRQKGGSIIMSIQDTGGGIAEQNKTRIFDPFFSTKEVGEGSGLGLSVSLNFIRQHGGDIQVESTPGKGSMFTVVLPVDTGLNPRQKDALNDNAGTAPAAERFRVLFIDDDERMVNAYRRLLKPYHDVVTALGGKNGIGELAKDQKFDAILCDLMMPDVDGVEVHDYLKENHPALLGKIIYITGGAFTARSKKFIDNISNIVLDKPVELPSLLSAIRKTAALH